VHGPEVQRTIAGASGTRFVRGWEQFSRQVKEGMRVFPQDFRVEEWLRWDNLQIRARADMAWVTYDQVAIRPSNHILSSDFQHETKILYRIDGEWKLVYLAIVVPGPGRNDTPQIELDGEGKVRRINAPARERLPTHPGLIVSGGRLRARDRTFDPRLQNEIRGVIALLKTSTPPGFMRRAFEAVPLGQDDFGRPVYCWVTIEEERLLVTFDDAYLIGLRVDTAAQVYALSPAQQSLARSLATGADLASAADELGVTVNTLRTQLRRMFEKTGTRTQATLISALLSVQRPS
jgi:DNA-binding CsgD family transcriptional regulator